MSGPIARAPAPYAERVAGHGSRARGVRSVLAFGLLFGASACEEDPAALEGGAPGVTAWLEAPKDDGGVLVVQVKAPRDATVDLPEPEVGGLALREDGETRVETSGSNRVFTRRFAYSGPKGSYEVPALTATWTVAGAEGSAASAPLWIDLDTPPPPGRESMHDLVEPPRAWTLPVREIALGAGVLLVLAGAAVAVWRRPAGPPPKAEVEAPHLRALRRWDEARADARLSEHQRAEALSAIFREYVEAALSFPALSWSTPEIVAHLQGMSHLPEGNVPRARRLLRATDLVKYAERKPGADFFEELDADLRAFVASTRPSEWGAR